MRHTMRPLLAAAVLITTTCSDATSPTETSLHTDAASYAATAVGFSQVEVRLITTYRNPADTVIVLDRCTPTTPYPTYFVDLIAPASSEGAGYNPSWACVGHNSPLVVGPKAVRIDTITLHGPSGYDTRTGKYLGAIAGTFRIGYGGQKSNEFAITLPPGGVLP